MLTRRTLLRAASVVPVGLARGGADRAAARTGEERQHSSFDPWVELTAAHLAHNVRQIAARVDGRPILAVIKNNGYGGGIAEVARALGSLPEVAGLAVVKLQEAMAVRDAGVTRPVVLMGPYDERELADLIDRDITPMVYRPLARELERIAASRQQPVGIHICVDTGIGRVGVPHREAEALIRTLSSARGVRIDGVMMTFAEDPEFDAEQLRRFTRLCDGLRQAGVSLGRRHAASSFTLFQRPDAFLDMVRPGMAIFGVYSEQEFRGTTVMALRPAISLKARVIYVKQLQVGDSAGYNRAYKATSPVWIATLPVGHTDGLPRGLVSGGRVRIGDRLYPIVGTVSASHCMIEVGAERTVEIGDVVTFFDDREGSRPEDVGAATGASVYDLLMHLNPLLPRRVV
ncbi:MAG: alanine racemase [Vicinamibacterales bacterium]